MLHRKVWQILTDISDELTASIIRVIIRATSQKLAIFILVALRT